MTDNVSEEKASALLKEAAALIREKGWCQRQLKSDNGEYCAMGAIEAKTERFDEFSAAKALMKQRIGGHSVTKWNDEPQRTKDEVLAALEGR